MPGLHCIEGDLMKLSHNGYHLSLTQACNAIEVEKDGVMREFRIPPLALIHVENEYCSRAAKSNWDIAPQRNRTDASRPWPVPEAVDADSLRLYHVDANGERCLLECGTDFRIDSAFCGITLQKQWSVDDHEFALDYDLRLQRVDVLAERQGEFRLFVGAESLVCPLWPRLPTGWLGVARLHLRFSGQLDESVILPVTRSEHARLVNYPVMTDKAACMPDGDLVNDGPVAGDTPTWPEMIDYSKYVYGPAQALERLRRKFEQAEKFRLAYFGDSITQGGDVDPEWRWTTRFSHHLEAQAPGKDLRFVNAAIGGTNSSVGRERFDRDVLAHELDAVTILFALNDNGMDDQTFLANHRCFVSELRKRDVEPILFTSNMNTAVWMPGLDHTEQRIVDFCRDENLICLDAYALWKDLPSYGIPYEALLANGINHPDNIAAGVFYELLKYAFLGEDPTALQGKQGD
jgi:lysophospholipase L1-like esterase